MKKILTLILTAAVLSGCSKNGPDQLEKATVVGINYVPATSGTGIGNSMKDGSMIVTSVSVSAAYGVIFKCQHGQFAIAVSREAFEKCEVGREVTLTYHEVFSHDGVHEKFETTAIDY